jgi:CheY-like chemotaxis protein
MPGIDGPALYRKATPLKGATGPAFVFMTGDLLTGQTATFLESTGRPCLRKPFTLGDVQQIMAQAREPVRSTSSRSR